jgi:hypothetical protein
MDADRLKTRNIVVSATVIHIQMHESIYVRVYSSTHTPRLRARDSPIYGISGHVYESIYVRVYSSSHTPRLRARDSSIYGISGHVCMYSRSPPWRIVEVESAGFIHKL